jgi:hypothetical protein
VQAGAGKDQPVWFVLKVGAGGRIILLILLTNTDRDAFKLMAQFIDLSVAWFACFVRIFCDRPNLAPIL